MAGIKFSRKEFEKSIKLTDEIKEKISLMKTHFESMNEEEVELEITPDRPDLYSLQGFLRAWNSFSGKTKGLKEYKINKSDAKIIVDKSVEGVRPYSMAAIVKGVNFTDEKIKEIMQWQEKIHSTFGRNRKKVALGYYDLAKVKFPIKYMAKEPKEIEFEPLDMPERMNALQILSRHPCGRDYGNQLDGMKKFPVYYDANNNVLSMPPIINSNKSGKINQGVTEVLIECSGFDLETLKRTITLAVVDLVDQRGKAYSVDVVYKNKSERISFTPEKKKLNIENVNKLLGLELKEADVKKLLEKMGYNYSKGIVEVPSYRTDIMHEVDIIEDIAIAYGYENFKPEIPSIATIGEIDKKEIIKNKISEILTGLGLIELSSYHLITKEDLEKSGEKAIEVEKSKSDYKFLRPNLLLSTFKILSENIDSEYPQKIFEIGRSFQLDDKEETGIKEKASLVVALTPGNFTEGKQTMDYLARMLGIEFEIIEGKEKGFIEGRVGKILFENQEIGIIGEIHPLTLKSWKLKMPLVMLDIDLEKIFEKLI